jgi:hypothetical protein
MQNFSEVIRVAPIYAYDELYGRKWSADVLSDLHLWGIEAEIIDEVTSKLRSVNGNLILTKQELSGPLCSLLTGPRTWERCAIYAVLVLLWGHASQSYGRFRIGRIVASNRLDLFGAAVDRACAHLAHDRILDAYGEFYQNGRNVFRYLGESFFSKILFFLSQCVSKGDARAYIKDIHTSRAAAAFSGEENILQRSPESYAAFLKVIVQLAREHGVSGERVEEVLFQSSRNQLMPDKWVKDENATNDILSRSEQEFEDDPPLVQLATTVDTIEHAGDYLHVLLIADGKPNNNLPPMTFGPQVAVAPLIGERFYSSQRQYIINRAVEVARPSGSLVASVVTTGFGIIPFSSDIPAYNVPGQVAVQNQTYVAAYHNGVTRWFEKLRTLAAVRPISIIYYAGKSRKDFREMVWAAIADWVATDRKNGKSSGAVMFGASQHLKGWDRPLIPCLFSWLDGNPGRMAQCPTCLAEWLAEAINVHPFHTIALGA